MTNKTLTDFEKQIAELEKLIDNLKQKALDTGVNTSEALEELQKKRDDLLKEFFSNLDAWDNAIFA